MAVCGPTLPISEEIHKMKYRGEGETFKEAMTRVADSLKDSEDHFLALKDILYDMRFLPAGRVQSAMGAPRTVTPYNCFVSRKIDDSMVGIGEASVEAAKTMQLGGGIGYDFSTLRPKGDLIKSLESRNDTLLKVANCIVEQQQAFFEYGDEAMKPMVLNDVAEMVEMHESTISRVTTQKYMHTPRGIYELKYFFSSHVSTENGGECSSTAIRALIKKLVAAENPAKPLSDSKITDLLAEQGIKVARRTIAKYRESLSIPPSNQRKSLI